MKMLRQLPRAIALAYADGRDEADRRDEVDRRDEADLFGEAEPVRSIASLALIVVILVLIHLGDLT